MNVFDLAVLFFIWSYLMMRAWAKRRPRIIVRNSLVLRGSLSHREWRLTPIKNEEEAEEE